MSGLPTWRPLCQAKSKLQSSQALDGWDLVYGGPLPPPAAGSGEANPGSSSSQLQQPHAAHAAGRADTLPEAPNALLIELTCCPANPSRSHIFVGTGKKEHKEGGCQRGVSLRRAHSTWPVRRQHPQAAGAKCVSNSSSCKTARAVRDGREQCR